MKAKKAPCGVCGRSFKNLGGLNAHLRLSKDAAHQAQRVGKPEPLTLPQAPPEAEPMVALDPKVPETPAPDPEPLAQQEATGPLVVSFDPPASVGPLLPMAPSHPSPPKVPEIPLAPVINGGVAVMVNGFFLRGENDGQLTVQEVKDSGFGDAAENALRHYFPDLAWDHPLVAVFVSGAGLAACIAAKKAPKPSGQRVNHGSQDQGVAEPEDASGADVGLVDPYWSSIQAQAGGAPNE